MKVPLKKNISFAYNEAFELIVMMGMIACEPQMIKTAEEYRIELDPLNNEIYLDAGNKMSPHMLRELQFFFGYDFFHMALNYAFYESIAASRQPLSAASWIQRLEEFPASEIVANMAYGVYYDKMEELLQGQEWEKQRKDLSGLIERVKLTQPLEEVKEAQDPLLECLTHPEETKQRYMMLISQFYRDIFTGWAGRIREESEMALVRYEAFFKGDPERFIRDIHKSEPEIFQVPSTIHVSFVSQVGNHHIWPFRPSHFWVIFGAFNDRVFGPAADREKAELFFKAFSDKRRIDFIMLLRERPRYGSELAAELGITPAAVIYHANFFFFLDLVEFKRSDHRLYYHLNEDKLRNLLALTAKVLLDE